MKHRVSFSILEIPLARGNDGRAPDWIHLCPFGKCFDLGNEKEIEVTSAIADKFISRFESTPTKFFIDYRHQTLAGKGPAPAACKVDRMEKRADGVWGHVEQWTPAGRKSVEDGEYNYISPVIAWNRPHRLTGERGPELVMGALTNIPNFPQMKLLAAEALGGLFEETDTEPLVAEAQQRETNEKESEMKKLIEWLKARSVKIADDADEAAALSALEAHVKDVSSRVPAELAKELGKETITVAEAVGAVKALRDAVPETVGIALGDKGITAAEATQRVMKLKSDSPDKDRLSVLEAEVKTFKAEKREARVDQAIKEGRITPADKPTYLSLFEADPALAEKIVAGLPAKGPLANALPVDTQRDGEVTTAEAEVARQLNLKPEQMKAAK